MNHITDEQSALIREATAIEDYTTSKDIKAFCRAVRGYLAREEHAAQEPVDVEQMLRDCVPGGSSCDPQSIADDIRAWFSKRQPVDAARVRADALTEAVQLYGTGDVEAPGGHSPWGEAHQEGWIDGTKAYRDAIRALIGTGGQSGEGEAA